MPISVNIALASARFSAACADAPICREIRPNARYARATSGRAPKPSARERACWAAERAASKSGEPMPVWSAATARNTSTSPARCPGVRVACNTRSIVAIAWATWPARRWTSPSQARLSARKAANWIASPYATPSSSMVTASRWRPARLSVRPRKIWDSTRGPANLPARSMSTARSSQRRASGRFPWTTYGKAHALHGDGDTIGMAGSLGHAEGFLGHGHSPGEVSETGQAVSQPCATEDSGERRHTKALKLEAVSQDFGASSIDFDAAAVVPGKHAAESKVVVRHRFKRNVREPSSDVEGALPGG